MSEEFFKKARKKIRRLAARLGAVYECKRYEDKISCRFFLGQAENTYCFVDLECSDYYNCKIAIVKETYSQRDISSEEAEKKLSRLIRRWIPPRSRIAIRRAEVEEIVIQSGEEKRWSLDLDTALSIVSGLISNMSLRDIDKIFEELSSSS